MPSPSSRSCCQTRTSRPGRPRLCGELEDAIEEHNGNIENFLMRDGYSQIEYHDSDEFTDETLTANDWLFDEDGDRRN